MRNTNKNNNKTLVKLSTASCTLYYDSTREPHPRLNKTSIPTIHHHSPLSKPRFHLHEEEQIPGRIDGREGFRTRNKVFCQGLRLKIREGNIQLGLIGSRGEFLSRLIALYSRWYASTLGWPAAFPPLSPRSCLICERESLPRIKRLLLPSFSSPLSLPLISLSSPPLVPSLNDNYKYQPCFHLDRSRFI